MQNNSRSSLRFNFKGKKNGSKNKEKIEHLECFEAFDDDVEEEKNAYISAETYQPKTQTNEVVERLNRRVPKMEYVFVSQTLHLVTKAAMTRKVVRMFSKWKENTLHERFMEETELHEERMRGFQERLLKLATRVMDQENTNQANFANPIENKDHENLAKASQSPCLLNLCIEEEGEDDETIEDCSEVEEDGRYDNDEEEKQEVDETEEEEDGDEDGGESQEESDYVKQIFPNDPELSAFIERQYGPLKAVYGDFALKENGKILCMDLKGWLAFTRYVGLADRFLAQRALVNVFRHHAVGFRGILGLTLKEMVYCIESCSALIFKDRPELIVACPDFVGRMTYTFLKIQEYRALFEFDPVEVEILKRKIHQSKQNANANVSKTNLHLESLEDMDLADEERKMFYLFRYYCSFGDKNNQQYMTSAKYFKMCKECGLLNLAGEAGVLHKQDVDLSFASVLASVRQMETLRSQKRALNFGQVQHALALLGKKCYYTSEQNNLVFSKTCYTKIRSQLVEGWENFCKSPRAQCVSPCRKYRNTHEKSFAFCK